MNHTIDRTMAISIPITATDRSQAELFSQHQAGEKKQQVYRNTLAVLVAQRYLQMVAIEASTQDCRSWNPVGQMMENVADLYLPEARGFLECRSVGEGDRKALVPSEVQDNRLGYLFIQLDAPYQEGIVLGFVPQVAVTEMPLSYLQPLDDLINRMTPINLGQWLQQTFEQGWEQYDRLRNRMAQTENNQVYAVRFRGEINEKIETLYRKDNANSRGAIAPLKPVQALVHLIQTTADDTIRWQATELLGELDPTHALLPVRSAKDLGLYLSGHTVALMVGVLAKPDGRRLILLRVCAMGASSYLPPALKLMGMDETGRELFPPIESRQEDNYIQYMVTADPGDRFFIKVALEEASVTESFVA